MDDGRAHGGGEAWAREAAFKPLQGAKRKWAEDFLRPLVTDTETGGSPRAVVYFRRPGWFILHWGLQIRLNGFRAERAAQGL